MLFTRITSPRSEDQQKIRMAVSLRRVDPGDVPESAKIRESSSVRSTAKAIANLSKRTATQAGLDHRKARVIPQTLSPSSAFEPEEVEEVAEDEFRDDLYCIMTTTVVGIQYYKGWLKVTCCPSHPFIYQNIVQVWLGQER